MKLTKYSHSCLVLENDGASIVIDPGNLSRDFKVPVGVVAIVLTHEHPDHAHKDHIDAILAKNPSAIIVGPPSLGATLALPAFEAVTAGATKTIPGFELKFFGDKHALIHDSIERVDNLGVLVNNLFYYPGDSFTLPGVPVKVLAVPAAAPWMRIGDAMDFLAAVRPTIAFPVHDAVASSDGQAIADRLLGSVAAKNGTAYERFVGTKEL